MRGSGEGVRGGGEVGDARGAEGEGQRRRPQSGGAAWQGDACGDLATGHAKIGMTMPFASQGSKQKTNRVTWCRIENLTTF